MELNLVCDYEGCGAELNLVYDVIEEYSLYLGDPNDEPEYCEDSLGIKEAFFRCPDCCDEVQITKAQLSDFIKWGDEAFEGTINGRLWFRHLKPYFEDQYEAKD